MISAARKGRRPIVGRRPSSESKEDLGDPCGTPQAPRQASLAGAPRQDLGCPHRSDPLRRTPHRAGGGPNGRRPRPRPGQRCRPRIGGGGRSRRLRGRPVWEKPRDAARMATPGPARRSPPDRHRSAGRLRSRGGLHHLLASPHELADQGLRVVVGSRGQVLRSESPAPSAQGARPVAVVVKYME